MILMIITLDFNDNYLSYTNLSLTCTCIADCSWPWVPWNLQPHRGGDWDTVCMWSLSPRDLCGSTLWCHPQDLLHTLWRRKIPEFCHPGYEMCTVQDFLLRFKRENSVKLYRHTQYSVPVSRGNVHKGSVASLRKAQVMPKRRRGCRTG